MRLVRNFLMGIGGLALLILAGDLVAPNSVHAIAAALVQVANTAANPAITQDVSKLSAQASQFWCPFSFVGCFGFPGTSAAYTVPSGKTLMVTAVDFVWEGSGAPTGNFYTLFCGSALTSSNSFGEWYLAGGTAPAQFVYPSGIPVPAGCAVHVVSAQSTYDVIVRGYLTAN